jgi:hypothetical protein
MFDRLLFSETALQGPLSYFGSLPMIGSVTEDQVRKPGLAASVGICQPLITKLHHESSTLSFFLSIITEALSLP